MSAFGRKIKTAIILTMNATEKQAKAFYTPFFDSLKNEMVTIFGNCEILTSYDLYCYNLQQVNLLIRNKNLLIDF